MTKKRIKKEKAGTGDEAQSLSRTSGQYIRNPREPVHCECPLSGVKRHDGMSAIAASVGGPSPIWEESHGMVQPENIDSGHSNSQLGARSGRYHHNLGRLRTNVISPSPTPSRPGSNQPPVISNWASMWRRPTSQT